MFNIAIVDDEWAFLQLISSQMLKTDYYNDIEIYKFLTCEKLLKEKEKINFHLIFMDIDLRETDGIEFVHKHFYNTPIIYITSHADRMADCIDHNVYQFVLKENIEVFFQNQFQDIYTRLKDSFIQINYNSNITLLDVNEVIYVKYEKRDIWLYTKSNKYIMKRVSLSAFMKHYQYEFLGINKNTYINWKHILSITKDKGVLLKGKHRCLPISSNRYYRLIDEYVERRGGIWF